MQNPLSMVITDPSQVGETRRTAVSLAASCGFGETKMGELALITTEATTNILRHAGHGEVLLRMLDAGGIPGIELLALDNGPGMRSVSDCLRDGYSSFGTAGNGLGAISRLSDTFAVYSLVDVGTILLSQLWARPHPDPSTRIAMDYGVASRPKPGQEICGDSWAVEHRSGRSLFFIADGLGHGPDAAHASRSAVRAFHKSSDRRPMEIIEAVHLAISGTRGAAAAVAEVDLVKQEVCFAGVGNIAGSVVTPTTARSMVSHNGIVGHQMRKVQEFVYPWAPNSLLVMHSDGLSSQWKHDRYPGLLVQRPELIAAVFYRDFQRLNDDATVLVAVPRPSASERTG